MHVLDNNLVPDCVRSNLRGSKFEIFLGEHVTVGVRELGRRNSFFFSLKTKPRRKKKSKEC